MKTVFILTTLLLVSCGKKEPTPELKSVTVKTVPEVTQPPVPQGKLPVMDPEKAKFIAAPSTPKDPQVKTAEKPVEETKKAEAPAPEAKKL